MPDTIDRVVRLRAAEHPSKAMVIDLVSRLSYDELDRTTKDLAAALIEAGIVKGTRVGLIMPNGARWVQIAIALTRIGAVLVPLSTLLQARELVAQLRTASVQFLISVEEFRGHRYLDELQRDQLPALREVWTADRLLQTVAGDATRLMVDALAATVTPSDTLAVMFTSGSSGTPKGVVHSHGNALGAVASGLASRCIDSDTRLYLPMPFFWVGGFGSGVLSALLAGATLVTEDIPQPDTTLRLLERERVTLFRGWPDQAEALARHACRTEVDLSALRPGSLEALLPPEQRAKPGARATLFGMTEAFGPYCGYPADTDMPQSAWGSCGKPFPGMEVRITDPDSGEPVAGGNHRDDRTSGTAHPTRDMSAQPRRSVYRRRVLPHRRPWPARRRRLPVLPRPIRRHVQNQRCHRLSHRSRASAAGNRRSRNAFVTNVSGDAGDRVGAAVVCGDNALTAGQLHNSARKLFSAFKVPTVWLLLDSDDDIPRGATGKVDTGRLRDMFVERL